MNFIGLIGLLSLVTGVRIFQYLWLYLPFLIRYPVENKNAPAEKISLIICARNEAKNLRNHLPLWLEQDYSGFEVIVVDDQSEDETAEYLQTMAKQHSHLKIVTIGNDLQQYPGKKLALMLGIKKASYDCLLFTDADCRPAGENWMHHMACGFNGGKKIVLGYAPLHGPKGSQSGFYAFETIITGLQYLSWAAKGCPYMGVGRNMGYRKSFFLGQKGFSGNLRLAQGDDDLFVSRNSSGDNTSIVMHPESYVYSAAKNGFGAWLKQKRRHLSTGRYYPFKIRAGLGLIWLTGTLFYLIPAFMLLNGSFTCMAGIIWGSGLLTQAVIFILTYSKFSAGPGWFLHPLYDIFYHCFYYPLMGILLWVSPANNRTWKR